MYSAYRFYFSVSVLCTEHPWLVTQCRLYLPLPWNAATNCLWSLCPLSICSTNLDIIRMPPNTLPPLLKSSMATYNFLHKVQTLYFSPWGPSFSNCGCFFSIITHLFFVHTPEYHDQSTLFLRRPWNMPQQTSPLFFLHIFLPVWSVFPTFRSSLLQIFQNPILSIGSLEPPLLHSVVWTLSRRTRLSGLYYPHWGQGVDRGGFAKWTVKGYWEGTVLLNLSLV